MQTYYSLEDIRHKLSEYKLYKFASFELFPETMVTPTSTAAEFTLNHVRGYRHMAAKKAASKAF